MSQVPFHRAVNGVSVILRELYARVGQKDRRFLVLELQTLTQITMINSEQNRKSNIEKG